MPEFPEHHAIMTGPPPGSPYDRMIGDLRVLLDTIAGAGLDEAQIAALHDDIRALTDRLAPLQVSESRQMFGRVQGSPGHGQTTSPAFVIDEQSAEGISGRITFGRYFLGANGAAHGGVIAMAFDEILGIPANLSCERMARTAFLHVNYRAITPMDVELAVSANVVSVDGRKRLVRGEIRHGDIVCADAESLFVELKPGQQ